MKLCYDKTITFDDSKGGLRILYAIQKGYIEYNFVHSIVSERNCDIWRMSVVNALDEDGRFLYRLTKDSAEWEMAIRLENRPDFIGGYAHGDEVGTDPVLCLDGTIAKPEDLTSWKAFSHLAIQVESTGFDPAAPEKAILRHRKQFVFDATGVHLEQEILWLDAVTLDSHFKSYLAMMPPVKHNPQDPAFCITDSFATDDGPLQNITDLPVGKSNVRSLTVAGSESAYRFTMSADGYAPLYPNSYFAFLTDNGKHLNYHKMYIAFAGGSQETIPAGTKWRAITHYQIEKACAEPLIN